MPDAGAVASGSGAGDRLQGLAAADSPSGAARGRASAPVPADRGPAPTTRAAGPASLGCGRACRVGLLVSRPPTQRDVVREQARRRPSWTRLG